MAEAQESGGAGEERCVLSGYLRKLKTMKKKFFVLRPNCVECSARLEYYDSEKKWRSGGRPKRHMQLKACFNIAQRLDTKHRHVIALYSSDESLCLVMDTEEQLTEWLKALLLHLHGESKDDLTYLTQHVWQVNMQKKGLGASHNIIGLYNLCLTDKKISLVKIKSNNTSQEHRHQNAAQVTDTIEFSLKCIRRCGDSECFFYMEVGRSAPTGSGELWMHTEDPNIAQSMHAMILNAMSSRLVIKDELAPKSRNRSSSANEASKPISVLKRRQTHAGSKSHGLSPSSAGSIGNVVGVRERCDSLPSRANVSVVMPRQNFVTTGQSRIAIGLRPHSMFVHGVGQSSPIVASSPLSPNSGACSTDSAGSSISIDETDNFMHQYNFSEDMSHLTNRFLNCLTPDERTIPEEVIDEAVWQTKVVGIPSIFGIAKQISSVDSVDGSSPIPIVTSSPKDMSEYIPMSPASVEPIKIPGASSACHSRTSSIAEESHPLTKSNINVSSVYSASHPPLSQKPDDGYVDMEPVKTTATTAMSPAESISSVTSGTPSTDIRFSEFHLQKVSSYFPSTEESDESRPARAYSVGSRPDHLKKIINRPEIVHSGFGVDSSRTRAFSVGSHYKHKDNRILHHGTPPHHHLQHITGGPPHSGTKSSSAPLLPGISHMNTPSRYVYNSSHSSAEQDDLMEMDFTNRDTSRSNKKSSDSLHHSTSVQSSLCMSTTPKSNRNVSEGYMDMSPVNVAKSDYVEMKPAEPSSGNSTPKTITTVARKTSLTKSYTNNQQSSPSTPEGYMEMFQSNVKLNNSKLNYNRISSLPIAINSNKKDTKGTNQAASSSISPVLKPFNAKRDEESSEKVASRLSPKTSPGVSPSSSIIPSPFSSNNNKRPLKNQIRREISHNPKYLMDKIYSSPIEYRNFEIIPKSLKKPEDSQDRKCSIDASEGTLKLSSSAFSEPIVPCNDNSNQYPTNDPLFDYNPAKLTTVTEMNETGINKMGVDKDMKQLINNATKIFDSKAASDFTDYISLNPNATVNRKDLRIKRQMSVEELITYSKSAETIAGPSAAYIDMFPVISNLRFKSNEQNSNDTKENQAILSSNPLANKSIVMSNPLTKSSVNISNINQMQNVRIPILVTVTGQVQPTTANFKPIPCSELNEPRLTKSGSPKPVESVLNRQLTGNMNDNKNIKSDGYEMSSNQNGQIQGKQSVSRPGSVNNNKSKKNNATDSRPPSVTSLGEVSGGNLNRSRPSSVSSEISSTPTNSRPASVTGEKENASRGLNYVSLELDNNLERSPRPPPTPVSNIPSFSYAQIDFIKSEELKNSKNLSAKSKN